MAKQQTLSAERWQEVAEAERTAAQAERASAEEQRQLYGGTTANCRGVSGRR
jgi:hypothetical protein